MRTNYWILGVISLLTVLFLSGAGNVWADQNATRKDCGGSAPGLGGGGSGEIPSPFNTMNQKAELADGELYFLVGRIVFGPPVTGSSRRQAYLEVNMGHHPWLANQKRRQFPFYPLEGPAKFWEKLEGQSVRMACEAHGRVVTLERGKAEHVIFLRPQMDIPIDNGFKNDLSDLF